MRWLFEIIPIAFSAYLYIQTGDYYPAVAFAVLVGFYEILRAVKKVSALSTLFAFSISYYFLTLLNELFPLNYISIILFSTGMAIFSIPDELKYSSHLKSAGFIIIGIAVLSIPENIYLYRYRLAIFSVMTLLGITSFIALLSDRFEFLIRHRLFLALLIILTSIYTAEYRQQLPPGLKSLIDWILVGVALYYFAGQLRLDVEEEPQIEKALDFENLTIKAEKEYIENGDPLPLAVLISYTFGKAGIDIEKAEIALREIIGREKLPKYTFGFERKFILSRRKRKRKSKLDKLREKLKEAGEKDAD